MKIAIVLTSLANKGPVLVARDICSYLVSKKNDVEVFYFDDKREVEFPCETKKIGFLEKINFGDYDVIHSHSLRPDLYLFVHFLLVKKKVPLVSTLHNYINQDLSQLYNPIVGKIFSLLWPLFLLRHNKIICLSKQMKSYYQKYFRSNKLQVIYNGKSPQLAEDIPIEEMSLIHSIKSKYTLIGVAASLIKRKGIAQLINSLSINERFALIIIGSGPEEGVLKELAESLEIQDRCIFLGYKTKAINYFHHFDIYAMTSYSEGFPLSLLEAGCQGLPVICSELNIFKEIFPSEVVFFELDNIKSLSEALDQLWKEKEKFSELILRKTLSNYSLDIMGESYLNLYKSLKA